MTRRRRAAALLAAAPVLLAITGCEVSGTADLTRPGTVAVDLTVFGEGVFETCRPERWPSGTRLESTPDPARPGQTGCHVVGDLDANQVGGWASGLVTWTDDRVLVLVPAQYFMNDLTGLRLLEVTVTFPGPVLDAGSTGRAQGNLVRWTPSDALATDGMSAASLSATALRPEWLVVASGLGGILFGAAAVAAASRLRRRRSRADGPALGADRPRAETAWPAGPPSPDSPPEDSSVWAPDP